MLLPAVTISCKSHNNLLPKNQESNGVDTKISAKNSITEKDKGDCQKIEQTGNKSQISTPAVRSVNSGIGDKDASQNTISTVPGNRINPSMKKSNGENLKTNDQQLTKGIATNFANTRATPSCVSHESSSNTKDYSSKKFTGEIEGKSKNYQIHSNYKETPLNTQDYKPRNSTSIGNIPSRYGNQSSMQRENPIPSVHQSRPALRNDTTVYTVARKAMELQGSTPKMAPINFPPLRAPQSIVNVRHPFVTEARTKHNEIGGPNCKNKLNTNPMQNSIKDLDRGRQTFHSYGTSQIAGIPRVQNLSNVTANIPSYPRPDTFPQPPVANVLFPDTSQFPQSPPFSTTQIGQINQYQTYDPNTFATAPVNVNPVIPQFSAENSMPYAQYENPPQFVQTNHYPTADLANSQYQYQAGVGQLQDSPMFIQSLQSPIAVTDQYVAPNYARAVRTELIPRLRRPPRFNK